MVEVVLLTVLEGELLVVEDLVVVVVDFGASTLHDMSKCLKGEPLFGVSCPGTARAEYSRH